MSIELFMVNKHAVAKLFVKCRND